MEMLDQVFLGNPLRAWLQAAAAFVGVLMVLPLVRRFVIARVRRIRAEDRPPWADLVLLLITRTRALWILVAAMYAGERLLDLPDRVERFSTVVIVIVAWLQAAVWGVAMIEFLLRKRQARLLGEGATRQSGSISVLMFVARVVLFGLATLLALDNLGVNITALVAGLGIGGIAVALAVQTILGDLLASLSITLDKPFEEGDWLRIDDLEGTVEHIGVKSTRLRSVSGEQIVLSNADLLKSRVRNMGRMPERRALFQFGVAYETPPKKLAEVAHIVERAVEGVPGTRFEYCKLRGFGESALQFEVVYFVPKPTTARNKFLDIGDEVNRRIHAAFAEHGIDFAYPTRNVIVRRTELPQG
jgi:small-conductance mechanosensitive channel